MRRKLCVIAAAALLVGSLAGCSGGGDNGKTATGAAETTAAETKAEETKGEDAASKEETEAAKKEASGELKKIVVGASPAPHAEILKAAQEVLAEKGYEGALKRGVKITGATVHYVDEGVDSGPIILQKAVEVKEGDTPEILQRRVMEEAEWIILPQAINMIANQ